MPDYPRYYGEDDGERNARPAAPRQPKAERTDYTQTEREDGYAAYAHTRSSSDAHRRSSEGARRTSSDGTVSRHTSPSSGSGSHRSGSASATRHTSDAYRSAGTRTGGNGAPHKKKRKKKKQIRVRIQPRFFAMIAVCLVAIALIIVLLTALNGNKKADQQLDAASTEKAGFLQELFKTPTPSPTPTPAPTPTPTPAPPYPIPAGSESAKPGNLGMGIKLEVIGEVAESYTRSEKIDMVYGTPYTTAQGIITFRGDNLRSGASYGTAPVTNKKLTKAWTVDTGELGRSDVNGPVETTWTGSGWVGQPLIVKWPDSTKRIMNLYDSAKAKENLVEVIYATMDGNIYFLDLETGEATRDKLHVGMPFKGAGALDPRGYPILYLGSGDMYASDAQMSRAMAYSLVDFTRLYEFGKQNDTFSLRDWHAYDSSPLVDAKTDTLIYPGENGILYTIKLNTNYDESAGTLTMNPSDVVKLRYAASRSTFPASTNTSDNKYWLGYETSIAVLGEYGYLGTNDGFLQCINLNTMSLVWAQDTVDDTNGSPVVEVDEAVGKAYVYIGCSLHFTADSEKKGTIPFMKVDASTGEILWKHEESVSTKSGVSGGIQATALLGKNNISDLVIIPFARTPEENSGVLLALDKSDGSVRWTYNMEKYTWSSPVAVYDESGNAYILVCEGSDTGGKIFLLDGKTGTLLSTFDAEKNIEASPAVYGDMLVIGTRGMKIWGIRIS